jgi:rhodanese-related sulfurtransferase
MVSRRVALAMVLLAGGAVVAGSLSSCASVKGWLVARKARGAPFRVVTPAVANEVVRDTPDVFILDLREPEEFQGPKGHLHDALNIPLARLPYRLLEIRSFRGETFLVYCDSAPCSSTGMKILSDSGFQDAMLIDGGIDGWIRSGFATFVRASTRRPPNARVKAQKNPELVPESGKPMDELPVVPPPLPPAWRSTPPPASGAPLGSPATPAPPGPSATPAPQTPPASPAPAPPLLPEQAAPAPPPAQAAPAQPPPSQAPPAPEAPAPPPPPEQAPSPPPPPAQAAPSAQAPPAPLPPVPRRLAARGEMD